MFRSSGGLFRRRLPISEFEDKHLYKNGRRIDIAILTNEQNKYCRIFYPDSEDKLVLGELLVNLGTQLIGEVVKENKND